MEDKKVQKEKVADSELTLTTYTHIDLNSFTWEKQSLCHATKCDNGYELKTDWYVKKAGHTALSGTFPTIEDTLSYVRDYLIQHEDLQDLLRKMHQEAIEASRKNAEINKAEKAKYYHLDLADLTPEHNIFYCDLISTKLKNLLGAAEVYTLADLCHWNRRDFKKIRGCGEVATAEVEKLLHHVGLEWGTPKKEPEIKEPSIFDDGFKAGYDAAVLAATTWLQGHPFCFTQPHGAEEFQKAMDKGI